LFVPVDAVGAVGVPVKAGLALKTTLPVPVDDVTPVPPLETAKTPVIPVVRGNPVTLVIIPDAGVPSAGVTNVGLFIVGLDEKTTLPVPVVGEIDIVGLPLDPLPLVTDMPVPPVIVTDVAVEPPATANNPVPDTLLMVDKNPLREIVGLPVVPSELLTDKPDPTAICTADIVFAPVFT
jgi:hypothetical protein